MVVFERHCGPKCQSEKHATELINAITKGNLRQTQVFISKCYNALKIKDHFGRTILHIAASCGKSELIDWLIVEKKAELIATDLESHWTALHRAMFYGQLTSARLLISHGANLRTSDKDGHSPLDIVMKDRLPHVDFVRSGLTEVFTWGDNSNFTLGHAKEHRRRNPESIDVFRKHSISIKQVVICKYHSIFLSTSGHVFTCGHGRGGRLGQNNESTCLEPRQVCGIPKNEICCQIDGSIDHTLMLMESGAVYSCGMNEYEQLGIIPPPAQCILPKQMNNKQVKQRRFSRIVARRYHTVLYDTETVFTFGLNAGQLGHLKVAAEPVISQPRQVSALIQKDTRIKLVGASDAATIVVTSRGDVYALHEYQCRRIVSKRLDIEQISVSGGHLDHKNRDAGFGRDSHQVTSDELLVAMRTISGKIFIWWSGDGVLRRCDWMIKRPLVITSMSLCKHSLAFITVDGEGFTATLPKLTSKQPVKGKAVVHSLPPSIIKSGLTLNDLVEQDEANAIPIERIATIHRAVDIIVDHSGRNFAVLQAQPNASLTDIPSVSASRMLADLMQFMSDTDATDNIHDVIIKVGEAEFAAHKYLLAHSSEYFHKLFMDDLTRDEVILENVRPDTFQQLLTYIYTNNCDVLTVGKKISFNSKSGNSKSEIPTEIPAEILPVDGRKLSAFEVYEKMNQCEKKKKVKQTGNKDKKTSKNKIVLNPVLLLKDASKRFGVKSLMKKLEYVCYEDGTIRKSGDVELPTSTLTFNRTKYSDLYDVSIKTVDGSTIQCHKAILVARLEYFRSMFASGWIEAADSQALSLPVPADVLQVIIDYIYLNEAPTVQACTDVEFVCNVLVLADQLLIGRLVDICQVTLATLITLRNACELLEFASLYNAKQLKVTCQQFIVINLAALFEVRALDVLSVEVMEDLTRYYKDHVPGMLRRLITPYDGWPDREYLATLELENANTSLDDISAPGKDDLKKSKSKKKRTRTKSLGDERLDVTTPNALRQNTERQISLCSESSFTLELDDIIEYSGESPTESPRSPIIDKVVEAQEDEPSLIMELRPTEKPSPKPLITVHVPTSLSWSTLLFRGRASDTLGAQARNGSTPGLQTQQTPEPHTPEPVMLRDIMAQQELILKNQTKQNGPRLSKKSCRGVQRERQRSSSLSELADNVPDAHRMKPKSSASNPWGSIAPVVQSFKDLMLSETPSKKELPHKNGHVTSGTISINQSASSKSPPGNQGDIILSWGLPTSSIRRPAREITPPQQIAAPKSPELPVNPWKLPPAPQSPEGASSPWLLMSKTPPKSTMPRLAEIMEKQTQETKSLEKAAKKPLHLIQIEEQAIEDLHQYYKTSEVYDEHITVERVDTLQATPTWAATQRHKVS